MADPQLHLAGQLREQAGWCEAVGSPLYAALLRRAADDCAARGPVFDVLQHQLLPGRGDALALRLMAAVHRQVLTGRAPELAHHYPSTGDTPREDGAWQAFRATVAARADELRRDVLLPCQTNEVGRCAALVGGLLEITARFELPLRLLEVGASAGLNLRLDHYRYSGGGASWGAADSPVPLDGFWRSPPPHTGLTLRVVARRGCDRRPVDPLDEAGRLALRASVWADQTARFARLEGALEVARRVPAVVDGSSLDAWLPERLAEPVDGAVTVVFHSVVDEYLDAPTRQRFHSAIHAAGSAATAARPFAWLRLEPAADQRTHGLTSTTWPGGDERRLAHCGAHGNDVVWSD